MSDHAGPSGSAALAARGSSEGHAGGVAWMLGILGAAAFLVLLGFGRSESPAPYFGTRLGMSERTLRLDFDDGASGTWSSSSRADDETVLRWTRDARRSGSPLAVVFELNQGKLVAIRADLDAADPLARGPAVESSFAAVVARRRGTGTRVHLTVLSRVCSKHVAEAAKLLAGASFPSP